MTSKCGARVRTAQSNVSSAARYDHFPAEAIYKLNDQFRHFTIAASVTRIALWANKKK